MKKKITRIFSVLVFLALVAALYWTGKTDPVPADHTGIIQSWNGTTSIYNAGESGFALPGLHRFFTIPTAPVTLQFAGESALEIAVSGRPSLMIEAQVLVRYADVRKIAKSYGANFASGVKNDIKEMITTYIASQAQGDYEIFTSVRKRIALLGYLHGRLNELLTAKGVRVDNLNLRQR